MAYHNTKRLSSTGRILARRHGRHNHTYHPPPAQTAMELSLFYRARP
ncbi:hypothetical protein Z950_1321 [Sulfitobacter mediterraneus KCTC 32188]|nr:hypothetical protein Z950_1321 [Sulfitobacter mediterraneus KCTC 32188]